MKKDQSKKTKELILNTLIEKTAIKKQAFNNTLECLNLIKDTLKEIATEYNASLEDKGCEPLLEYKDRGIYELEFKIAGDMIVFNMHTNIFDFDKSHNIWKMAYVQKDPTAAYCGVINVYNFLADSYKYSRLNDIGYLIARIFINKEQHYFIEGKRQLGFLYDNFDKSVISPADIRKILESTLLFTLDFDLLVPEYDQVNMLTVAQMKENINNSKTQTAKRLGFKFNADNDDVD